MTKIRKPVVGADAAASYLGISQPRLRQLVEEGRIAVVRLGRVIAYPAAELERLRAERQEDARSTAVAELLSEPVEPLRMVHDTVLRVPLTPGVDDQHFHVRVWDGPERQVVLVSPAGPTRYVSQPRIEDIMAAIDERLLGGTGDAAAWFTLDYDEGLTGTTISVANVVSLVRPARAGASRDTRPSKFSQPSWSPSGLGEVRRVAGCGPITVFPLHGNDVQVVERHARTGRQVHVEVDHAGIGDGLRALRTITARRSDDPRTADDAATLLARTLDLRAGDLARQRRDGRWDDGRIDDPDLVMGAILEPVELSPTDQELVAGELRHRDVPQGDRLQGLYVDVRTWQERVDEWSATPDADLLDALGQVADLIGYALRDEAWASDHADTATDETKRFLTYPRWRLIYADVTGENDESYLRMLTQVGADGSRDHRILSSDVARRTALLEREAKAWTYCRDRDGNLVAQAPAGSRARTFAVLWPIDPPTAGLPDDAVIVSDGEAGERPAYIVYPNGTVRLLPRRPGESGQWNFGYGGGGPGELAAAIIEAYRVSRRVDEALVPTRWIRDAVSHSSQDELRLRVADITRRLGTES